MGKITKNTLLFLGILIFSLSNVFSTFAMEDNISNNQEIQTAIEEINSYLEENPLEIDFETKKTSMEIPLSNGKEATVTYELKKVDSPLLNRTIFDAKIGIWDFISTLDLGFAGISGKITVTTTVNIYYVPYANSSSYDTIKFSAYNGRVNVTPALFHTVSGSSASTRVYEKDIWYKTTGYVGIKHFDMVNYNFYYTQDIRFVDNNTNKTKIYLSTSLHRY